MAEIKSSPITAESIMEILNRISLSIETSREEFDRRSEEYDRRSEELKEELAASRAEYDRRSAELKNELAASSAELNRKIKNVSEMIGGLGNSNGLFAEEFFYNALNNGDRNLFGEHFDDCFTLINRFDKSIGKRAEHDIFLINGISVAVVEVKYKAQRADVQKIIKRLPGFKTLFKEHDSRRIYLGLAAMSFEKGVEDEAESAGIAIIKQIGEAVILKDEHVKSF